MPLKKIKVDAEAGIGTGSGIEIERLASLQHLEMSDVCSPFSGGDDVGAAGPGGP
jgi:hypothetical protein